METKTTIPNWKDKILFTPGPLTTSRTVKQSLLRDLGSRDYEFIYMVADIRQRLLEAGGVADGGYEAIIMQGSGTFSLESVISSTIPPEGKLLVIINGAYGQRIAQIAKVYGIEVIPLIYPENRTPDLAEIESALKADQAITSVAVIHCETTTGIINPIKEIGEIVKRFGKDYFVDAMSSFGGVPFNLAECGIDYMVSSANKCVEGIPGFGIILAKRDTLLKTEGYARTFSLDLLAQLLRFDKDGQFRFTPPTHSLLAYHQALIELELEGGVEGRAARYRANYETLIAGMRAIGFKEYIEPEDQGFIITSFPYPDHPNFDFEEFYRALNERDYVIYPGKVSDADCFRIGSIGRILPADMHALLAAIRETLGEMEVEL
ncbi:MAG: 2-aminoethylphosphonate--pyruvate transaminase [Anaerolineales bacterium]|uniref:2-aminoethylphosphonate--pyruvate transaminase n=1 Tax=Candidatus Desulfolinea nitratireducens TaxID=2841698 RepID=A0A8J6TJW4_9CHLR|nr:2-aminoethylphosphonate--pyruvate transaminase [Candidatus Desulfolinea nitratireducens]